MPVVYKNNDVVVTLGIKPTRPETGYGYIETKKLIDGEIYSVNAFKEKPDSVIAQMYFSKNIFCGMQAFLYGILIQYQK